jgi:F0F1-type ATP synthase membrane subunit b/b'
MFRPLNEVIQARIEYFDKIQYEIASVEKETLQIRKQLEDIDLADKKKIYTLKKELEDGAKVEVDKVYLAAKEDVFQLKNKIEVEIESKITEARKFLGKEAEILSMSIVDKILSWRHIS